MQSCSITSNKFLKNFTTGNKIFLLQSVFESNQVIMKSMDFF